MKKLTSSTPLCVTFSFEIEPEKWAPSNPAVTHKVSMSGLFAEQMLDVPDSLANKIAQWAVVELAHIAEIPAEEESSDS